VAVRLTAGENISKVWLMGISIIPISALDVMVSMKLRGLKKTSEVYDVREAHRIRAVLHDIGNHSTTLETSEVWQAIFLPHPLKLIGDKELKVC